MLNFQQVVSVNFQGVVVVFGRPATGTLTDIYFNVLGQDFDINDDALAWSGFTSLEFPGQVRQIGMSLITLKKDGDTMTPAAAPFRVITDQKFISVIQQSARGTLYVNRFRLLKTQSGSDQKKVTYSLAPAWEVRFARSHDEDVPADKSDKQDYLDPEGKPFLEPSLELAMIDGVADGAFDVALLPISGKDSFAWQFLTLDKSANLIRLYNFPADANGLFDLSRKTIGANFQIAPDSTFSVGRDAKAAALPFAGAPRATTYVKHEKVVQLDGTSIGVRRATRVMLALPVTDGGKTVVATIDSAVGSGGTLAKLSGLVTATDVVPAAFDLRFNGVSKLALVPPGGTNPLALTGAYAMAVLMAPGAKGDGVPLIGGDLADKPEVAAPYLRIVEGDKLEVGFGTGSAAVACRTLHQVLFTDVWTDISVTYSGAGNNPFVVTINGVDTPLTTCTVPANPGGTPISQIAAASGGFVGALKRVSVTSGGTKVLHLDCNTVNYASTPPTTPNSASSGVTATVIGPKLEPSTSPVNSPMSGAFHIDGNGLTYYAGITPFISPQSDSCLIEGSDGLLHLYYKGADADLTVAQFSTEASRSTFSGSWSTDWSLTKMKASEKAEPTYLFHGQASDIWTAVGPRLLQAPDATQTGFLNFVAHRVGTYMNTTKITVSASPVSPLLCDVTVTAADNVGTETWTGLPRDIAMFERIWNGAASSNPDDKDVQSRSRPYFDYAGKAAAVVVPAVSANGGYFLMTSVARLPISLGAVEVAAGRSADFVTITTEINPPANWPKTDPLRQVWPDVARDPQSIIDTLAGKKGNYPYDKVTTPGTRSYGLRLSQVRSDDQVTHLTVFVRNVLLEFTATISNGTSAELCKVEICGQLLKDVPRDQASFARIINGEDKDYAYPAGYTTGLATQIYALGTGLTADVVNQAGAVTPGGALAYAGLVRVLYQGQGFQRATITTIPRTLASAFQSAKLQFDGTTTISAGSMLFGAIVETAPSNGGIGRLANTSMSSSGYAQLRSPGVNGGWMPVSPRFSLGLNATKTTNQVNFNVAKGFLPAEKLAIASDLTLETWINQDEAKAQASERVMSYTVPGNMDRPDFPIRAMIGALQGPGLTLAPSTFVSRAFNFAPPALSVQVYLKLPDQVVAGTIFSVNEINGGTEYLSLTLDAFGKANLNFMSGAGVLKTASMLPTKTWICLTAVVGAADGGKVNLSLAINDKAPVTGQATNTFTGMLGALTLGSRTGKGISGTANGVAFWQRALSAEEVRNSFLYGFPDSDPMLGIRWNLAEGRGTVAANSAASGPEFDGPITNPAPTPWDKDGAFKVPYAGRNDLVLASNRILKGWTHVALASRQGNGLTLNGKNSGKISNGDPFNPSASFAIEAWISPKSVNQKQIILEKPGSYSLYVNTAGQVCLKVEVQQDSSDYRLPPVNFTYEVKAPIKAGETSYISVNFTTGTVQDTSGSKDYVPQKYYVRTAISVNNTPAVTNDKLDYTKPVKVRNRKSALLLGMAETGTFNFEGLLSHLRIWSRTTTQEENTRTFELRTTPVNADGLIAGWDFDEGSGTSAVDINGNYTFELTSNQLWTVWQEVAQAQIIVNGRTSNPQRLRPADVGDYGGSQFTFGGSVSAGKTILPFHGQIDDVRLFKTRLTEQQVREGMSKPLTGGEDNLAAYWKIDAGSGPTVYDMTGQGNNGTLAPDTSPPAWLPSSAPLQNEAQYVVNTIGGEADYYVAHIDGAPSVIEYASAEKDAYGKVFSVMKRGYFYRAATGETELQVGYKIGDLDTIFVGQVQSKPTIIGYIEGGPPLPSENQTLAYWVGDNGGPARSYAGTSTVTYAETETKTWTFTAASSSTFNGVLNAKGGLIWKSKADVSVGLGAEATTKVVETEVKLGAKLSLGGDIGSTDAVAQNHSNTLSLSTTLSPPGTWEPLDDILNPVVGRRYIPNNIGIALVKSATADLFMLALKGTQTPVGYIMAPNDTIPVDSNIIDFPINPNYVKNGTLDGKVGLVNDPNYPEANDERGSYFKPVEAYATKRRIEKQEKDLKAYYDQFDVNKYRLLANYDNVKAKLQDSPAFDFKQNRNLRSMVNTYVWTAAGGMHREEQSFANTYTETYTGASNLKFAMGAEFAAKVTSPAGGFYVEADTMLGNTWTMTATKSESTQNGFRLTSNVIPTDFLQAPIITDGVFKGYARDAAPGKVDAYRYMSFLIAPEEDNFTQLRKVVDANWLANSTTAGAAAMREAMNNPSTPWRVLHRTTYVSRVPAPFQPVKDDTDAPNITAPANLLSNRWLIEVLNKQIGKPDPTRLEIGAAIDALLGATGGQSLLATLIPWWPAFLTAAQVYGSDEFRELAALRSNMLTYMADKYAADAYAEQ